MCSRVFYYCCLSATLSAVTATSVQACLILAILRDTGQHACTLHSLHNRLRFLECTSPTLHLINTTAPRSSACCRSIQLNKVWRLALLSLDICYVAKWRTRPRKPILWTHPLLRSRSGHWTSTIKSTQTWHQLVSLLAVYQEVYVTAVCIWEDEIESKRLQCLLCPAGVRVYVWYTYIIGI